MDDIGPGGGRTLLLATASPFWDRCGARREYERGNVQTAARIQALKLLTCFALFAPFFIIRSCFWSLDRSISIVKKNFEESAKLMELGDFPEVPDAVSGGFREFRSFDNESGANYFDYSTSTKYVRCQRLSGNRFT